MAKKPKSAAPVSKIGFNNFPKHARCVRVKDAAELKTAFKSAGFVPRSRLLLQPVTRSPMLLVRYRRGEFHSVSPCGSELAWKQDHFTQLAGRVPAELSQQDLDRVADHLQVDLENIYFMGQLNLTEESWHAVRRKLHTLSTVRDLVAYLFEYKKINPKLAALLHFHTLDVLGLSNGKIVRIPPNGTDAYQRIQSFGFSQLWPNVGLGAAPLSLNARELSNDAVADAVEMLRRHQSNVDFGVEGVRPTPLFQPQTVVLATAFPPE